MKTKKRIRKRRIICCILIIIFIILATHFSFGFLEPKPVMQLRGKATIELPVKSNYVEEGVDATYKGEDVTLTKPPYYVFRAVPKLHHCMGGVRINVKAQVISKNTQGPIPGLFAG